MSASKTNPITADEKWVRDVVYMRQDVYKSAIEGFGEKMPETKNDIGYKNYYIANPITMGGAVGGMTGGQVGAATGPLPFVGKSNAEKYQICGITSTSMGPGEVKAAGLITNATFPHTDGPSSLDMNKNIVEDLRAICTEILQLGFYKINISNSYRGSNSVGSGMSRHCWGCAIDMNAGHMGNPWFKGHSIPKNEPEPQEGSTSRFGPGAQCPYHGQYTKSRCIWHWEHPVVKIFLAHNWGWGGSYGDVMHFSIDGH